MHVNGARVWFVGSGEADRRVGHTGQGPALQLQVVVLVVLAGSVGQVEQEHVVGEGLETGHLCEGVRQGHTVLAEEVA